MLDESSILSALIRPKLTINYAISPKSDKVVRFFCSQKHSKKGGFLNEEIQKIGRFASRTEK